MDSLEYLWDGSEPGWVLMDLRPDSPDPSARYLIMNVNTNAALVLEDDAMASRIIADLIRRGMVIVRPGPRDQEKLR